MDVLHAPRIGPALQAVKLVRTLNPKQTSKADIECVVVPEGLRDSVPSDVPKFTMVFGDNLVETVCAEQASRASIFLALKSKLGEKWEETKLAAIHGGVETEQKYLLVCSNYYQRLIPNRDAYFSMPVVAICSKARHAAAKHEKLQRKSGVRPIPNTTSNSQSEDKVLDCTEPWARVQETYDLDLHTSEGYIAVTSTSLTLEQACLDDLLVDGVLNLYCVERENRGDSISDVGKEAIFGISSAWVLLLQSVPGEITADVFEELPTRQSRRGMAAFLSALRMFSDLIGASKMEEPVQDSIIRLFHVLTRFPPAVLTIFTLMQGNTPTSSQCRALIRSFLELLKTIIPTNIIRGDDQRYLEASRLAFGFILAKARQLKTTSSETPFLYSIKTIDLTDARTLQPIRRPVSTSVGVLEEGHYKALQPMGSLHWCKGQPPPRLEELDTRALRLAFLSGGRLSEIVIVDMDQVTLGLKQEQSLLQARDEKLAWNLYHLAELSERQGLGVEPPCGLPSSEAPILTLDRTGFLAVYLGKAACAEPGKE